MRTSSRRSKALTLLFLLPTMAGALVLGQGTAAAYPSNCSSATWGNGATAQCLTGTGNIRAVSGCKNAFGFYQTVYAPWQNINRGASRVACAFGYSPQWHGFNLS